MLGADPTSRARPASNPINKSCVVGFLNPVCPEILMLWFLLIVKPADNLGDKNPSKNYDLSYRTDPVNFSFAAALNSNSF